MSNTDHLKPLFNRRLLREALRTHPLALDAAQRALLAAWAASAATRALIGKTEQALKPQFLSEIFDRVLGYRQIVGEGAVHHMEPETGTKQVKGYRPADARLGWYTRDLARTRVVVEVKGPGADLDAKQGGNYGNLTPVEQAFGYAAKVDGCRWVIVTNFTTVRLYRTDRGQGYCQSFDVADLADEEALRSFLFLLHRKTLLGDNPDGQSAVDQLAARTHVQERDITAGFYRAYRSLRIDLFSQLRQDNPPAAGAAPVGHEMQLLEHAQKLLDRSLFVCFCEDKGLLPAGVLARALSTRTDGFVPVSRWQQLCGLFTAIDTGMPSMQINGYNGGLFARDAAFDALVVSEASLYSIQALGAYDFESDLNVNILGHVFEQSVTDLEAIRSEIHGGKLDRSKSRRKREGIVYTPEWVTRFIVSRTIGGWLSERYAKLEAMHRAGRTGPISTETRLRLARDYLEVLRGIKVLDPACGSGAFLVAAFDFLLGEYERVNRTIAQLTGAPDQIALFDLDREILQGNLYGVDLNHESVEITKLSLWLKTARRDKPLNNLDANIRCGNSLVEPPAPDTPDTLRSAFASLPPDPRPFDWHGAFSDVMARGGFDVVIGNPPYVRQEALGAFKPYFAQRYRSYDGKADLFVYFYERGLELLAPEGKLSYIVNNKWLRSGYGEPLRRLFTDRAEFEEIINFGHAPIFEDVDTFPCIVVAHLRPSEPSQTTVRVCEVPRDRPPELSLEQFVEDHGFTVPSSRCGAAPWSLEPPLVDSLMQRIRARGVDLAQFAGVRALCGVKTGLNEAFLIDDATRTALVRDDPRCAEIIKPYLRGQDVRRWAPEWQRLWMIALKSSNDFHWPWAAARDSAEYVFGSTFPSLYARMKPLQDRLMARQDKGKYWWELRSCDYYGVFEQPKIVYQEIQFHPQYGFSTGSLYSNNKVFILPSTDRYLLAVLNSPLMWWHNWRYLVHMKDDALSPAGFRMETLPIAEPTLSLRHEVEERVDALLTLTRDTQAEAQEFMTWLRVEHAAGSPTQRLQEFASLSGDEFIAEVRKSRPKAAARLSPAAVQALLQVHESYAGAERQRAGAVLTHERQLSDLVNQAYGLTQDDIKLMWATAPPRMPRT
jgi:hypothetical protein